MMLPARGRVMPVFFLVAGLLAWTEPPAGVVFREAESVDNGQPETASHQIRQVFAEADNCKVVMEESSDPLVTAGSYVLASSSDAFLVDPVDKSIAPMDPTTMLAVTAAAGDPSGTPVPTAIAAVSLQQQFDGPGPDILGYPTRHLVFRLHYVEHPGTTAEGTAESTRWDERHEIWLVPWEEGEVVPVAWQKFRIMEDAGSGADRQEIQDAMARIYEHGLVIRQTIERRFESGGAPDDSSAEESGQGAGVERIVRDVTSFSRQDLSADVFEKPAGYRQAEFLAPQGASSRGEGPGVATDKAAESPAAGGG